MAMSARAMKMRITKVLELRYTTRCATQILRATGRSGGGCRLRKLKLLMYFAAIGIIFPIGFCKNANAQVRMMENTPPSMRTISEKCFQLTQVGINTYYPAFNHRAIFSRYEVAALAHSCIQGLKGWLDSLEKLMIEDSKKREYQDQYQELSRLFELIEFVCRATLNELMSMEVDPFALDKEFSEIAKRFTLRGIPVRRFDDIWFTDVPKKHWADNAVHELRKVGILWGYPNGSFNGTKGEIK